MRSLSQAYALTESFAVRYIKLVLMVVVVLLVLSLRGCIGGKESQFKTIVKTDTLYKNVIKEVKVIAPADRQQPTKVFIYLPDTITRKRVEAGDIITGVKLEGGKLVIDKISPVGITTSATYPIPELAVITIDVKGNVSLQLDRKARRKERLRKIGNTALIFAAGLGGVLLGTTIK